MESKPQTGHQKQSLAGNWQVTPTIALAHQHHQDHDQEDAEHDRELQRQEVVQWYGALYEWIKV